MPHRVLYIIQYSCRKVDNSLAFGINTSLEERAKTKPKRNIPTEILCRHNNSYGCYS